MSERRTGITKEGEKVYLGTYKVDGGWEGYALNGFGDAVLVFIPEGDSYPMEEMEMSEIQIERNEYGQWEVYVDGSPKGEFETKAEAETFAARRARLPPADATIYHGSLAGD